MRLKKLVCISIANLNTHVTFLDPIAKNIRVPTYATATGIENCLHRSLQAAVLPSEPEIAGAADARQI